MTEHQKERWISACERWRRGKWSTPGLYALSLQIIQQTGDRKQGLLPRLEAMRAAIDALIKTAKGKPNA